ncbi:hypothetical protein BDZ89DRAFT_1077482 [Hymenopellis radicata]|nr:hypothetical protein BDZ89DRAFT_1077482 [Hymenopellis radicata]
MLSMGVVLSTNQLCTRIRARHVPGPNHLFLLQSDEQVHRPRRNPRLIDSRWLYGL